MAAPVPHTRYGGFFVARRVRGLRQHRKEPTMRNDRGVRAGGGLVVVAWLPAAAGDAGADMLDPAAFASLGTLNAPAGSYAINTSTLQFTGPGGTPLATGVLDPSGQIAVFTFDSILLDAGATVVAKGSR